MACVKHYALYGASVAGRDYNMSCDCHEFMRSYQVAVEAGVGSIMTLHLTNLKVSLRPEILGFLITYCVNNEDLTALSCLILR